MAARSTDVVFHNQTDFALVKVEDGLDHGIWTDPWQPPGVIGPHADGEWRSESDGVLTGTEGHVRYRVGSSGRARSRVTAVSRRPGQLDLFVVGDDGVVYTAWWTEGQEWSGIVGGWRPIGGVFPADAPIAAVARTPDNLDLFIVGNDGVVYTSWWYAGQDWSGLGGWRPIGGTFPVGAPLAAVARTPNNLDLFVTGNDGVVYTSWWYAGVDWSGVNNDWRPIGGTFPVGAPLAAVARTPNNLDLFIVGNDGVVYTSWWYAGQDWSGLGGWRPIGGTFPVGAPLAAVARTPDNLDLFIVGNDGVVYTSWWYAGVDWSGFGGWRPIGGYFPAGARVAAVARTGNNLDLFVTGNDGVVYTSWWYSGADWSGINNSWRPIGGYFPAGASLATTARTGNNLDLFVVGNDGVVYTSWWYNGADWSGINNSWRPIAGPSVYFHWDNPYSGHNKYHLFPDVGLQALRAGGDGDNARVEVTVRPALVHRAGDFTPSMRGFHFSNSFGEVPYSLPPLRGSFLDYKYGNAKNGLCGGMVYAARDYFEANVPIPATNIPPPGEQDPLFVYFVNRLFDSFTVADISLYLKYMNPAYPDTDENVLSTFGLADGRASVVINTEWPLVRADIDAGHPSPLGLITIKSYWPGDLGANHQVMAYAYLENGTEVTLWVYDPNQHDNENVTISFSTLAWDRPLEIKHNVAVTDGDGNRRPIYCFFRTNYTARNPIGPSVFRGSGVVAVAARTSADLQALITGSDGVVYTSSWSNSHDWSGTNNNWQSIGGYFPAGSPLTAVARGTDHFDAFIVGGDGIVYTSWFDAGKEWSGAANNWRPIGGLFPVGSTVTAVARTPNNLDLFIVGNDGVVYTSWWVSGADWSGINNNWRPIGGYFPVGARVAAVARTSNNLDLFVTGNDGVVYTSWWYSGADWSGIDNDWRSIGGFFPVGAPLAATARTGNNLDLFVVGNDGAVYTSWWYNGADWSGINNTWRSIGGYFPPGGPIAATARKPDQLDAFIVGNDGVAYTSWWTNGADWSGVNNNWRPIGGTFPPTAPLTAFARTPDNQDLFVIGNDGVTYTSWWSVGVDWSGIHNNWRPIGGYFPIP